MKRIIFLYCTIIALSLTSCTTAKIGLGGRIEITNIHLSEPVALGKTVQIIYDATAYSDGLTVTPDTTIEMIPYMSINTRDLQQRAMFVMSKNVTYVNADYLTAISPGEDDLDSAVVHGTKEIVKFGETKTFTFAICFSTPGEAYKYGEYGFDIGTTSIGELYGPPYEQIWGGDLVRINPETGEMFLGLRHQAESTEEVLTAQALTSISESPTHSVPCLPEGE